VVGLGMSEPSTVPLANCSPVFLLGAVARASHQTDSPSRETSHPTSYRGGFFYWRWGGSPLGPFGGAMIGKKNI